MGTRRQRARRLIGAGQWPDPLGVEVSVFPDRGVLISHARSGRGLLFPPGRDRAHGEVRLPEHASLKAVDGARLSYLQGNRQTATLFSLDTQAIESETTLPFGVTSALYLSEQWIVSRLHAGKLFHRVSAAGEMIDSFGSAEAADQCAVKSLAGEIQPPIAMSGMLAKLGPTSFVYTYDAVPLVEAYDLSGKRLWTATLQHLELPTAAALDARWKNIQKRNAGMQVVRGMVFPINAAAAVGPRVAVLHYPNDGAETRLLSLLDLSGVFLDAIRLKKDVVAMAWESDRLWGARAGRSGEMVLDELQANRVN